MTISGPGRLRAVIFDIDGTLFDSERDGHRRAFNEAFAQAGMVDRWSVDLYGQLLDTTGGRRRLAQYLEAQGYDDAEALAEALHARKTTIMRQMVIDGMIPPRRGATDLLDLSERLGLRCYVATTGSRAWVEPLLDKTFGLDRFAEIFTGTEVPRLKPDPAVYREVLRSAVLSSTECVAIEDSASGVRAAIAADLNCLAVTNDYTKDHDVSAATLVTDRLDDPLIAHWLCEAAGVPSAR